MKLIRKYVKNMLTEMYDYDHEDCMRKMYWGVGGSGVVVLCTEDNTIYMQQRSYEVNGGQGKWGFPGGGIHTEQPKHHKTPIKHSVNHEDPVLELQAFKELEEEAGYRGIPKYRLLDALVSYEDCGFIFKTFIIDIPYNEKRSWQPQPYPEHAWEIISQNWFSGKDWKNEDIYFGFTDVLINKIDSYIG